jgi:cadmium resistance protein CadD (predicted permease)
MPGKRGDMLLYAARTIDAMVLLMNMYAKGNKKCDMAPKAGNVIDVAYISLTDRF